MTGEFASSRQSSPRTPTSTGDGDVDGRDFLIWQRGFGGPGSLATGDANSDGQVNADDLAIWQNQYGSVPELNAASIAVPEPALWHSPWQW